MSSPRVTAPIVVVGGGTAGCTVASHLAARTNYDIVLVEPGPSSSMDEVPGFFDVLARSDMVRRREVTVVRGGPVRTYMEARALGGGSAVNGMVLSGDAPPELAGLTRIARADEAGEIGTALLRAGGEPVRLWWNGGRWNPGRAVAHLVEEGRIVRMADEVVVLRPRVDSVVVGTGAGEIVASHVVMCAGAIATPLVLLSSGLGSADSPIGKGIQTHPMISFVLHRATPRADHEARFDAVAVRRGVTDNGRQSLVVAYERASGAEPHLGLLSVMVMDVESRGAVRWTAGGDTVEFNCLDTPGDRRAMVDAVRTLIGIASTPAMVATAPSIAVDDTGANPAELGAMGDKDIEAWLSARVEPAFHATSSCAAAVDGFGRLVGSPRVWVADASVLERTPSCTPAGPVTMEARRIAGCIEGVVAATAG